MAQSRSMLDAEVVKQVQAIQEADIVVGIPSYHNAPTIAHVVKTVSDGLSLYFPHQRAVIVNADGNSKDGTQDIVANTQVAAGINKIVTSYKGLSGKGSAFHTIFEIADRLGVKSCVVVDSDLRSITPEWIRVLAEPIYQQNIGFVTPYYCRHKNDGTITNSIAFPLMCALYGKGIRQPIGGEFALSGGLAKILSHQNVWESDVARFGIDIWLTTTAVCEGFRICQANMGVKLHDEKDPGSDLAPMFRQVVGTIFTLMKKYEIKWKAINVCQPVELFGQLPREEPESINVDLSRLLELFMDGTKKHMPTIETILGPENNVELDKVIEVSGESGIFFPDALWARAVYDHAIAFNYRNDLDHQDVLTSIMVLFYGRTADFIRRTETLADDEVEQLVVKTAGAFATEKPYLIKKWSAAVPKSMVHS